MEVLHGAGVIVTRDSARLSRIGTSVVGVHPSVAEIVEIGEQALDIGGRSWTQAIIQTACVTPTRSVVLIFAGVDAGDHCNVLSADCIDIVRGPWFHIINAAFVPIVSAAKYDTKFFACPKSLSNGSVK